MTSTEKLFNHSFKSEINNYSSVPLASLRQPFSSETFKNDKISEFKKKTEVLLDFLVF